jgi:hypothetical protein
VARVAKLTADLAAANAANESLKSQVATLQSQLEGSVRGAAAEATHRSADHGKYKENAKRVLEAGADTRSLFSST